MQTGIAVRAAVPSDAAQMAALHVRAWRATYAGILPDGFLAGLKVADREAMWGRSLTVPELAPAERVILVAEAEGALLGLAAAGHARGDDELGLGELYSINVDPPAWGRGAGRALLAATSAWLDGRFAKSVLWVGPVGRRQQPARAHVVRTGRLDARRRDEARDLRRDERRQLPLPARGGPLTTTPDHGHSGMYERARRVAVPRI
jgi:GNAT superfamily N-acetyltransferase